MRDTTKTFPKRQHPERGVVLPLVCLMLAGLIGLVALAVDLGAHYLNVQRRSVVVDLAALSGADLHMRGASEEEIKNHIRYLVNANDSFNVAAGPTEWPQEQDLEINVSEDINEGRVAVNRQTHIAKYFSGIFGGGAIGPSEITSAAGYDLTPSVDEPVHLVLLLDSSWHTGSMYGDGCSEGVTEISCLNQQDETKYCPSGCASRLDVEKELVRTLARELSENERLTLIDFSGVGKVLGTELVPGPGIVSEVDSLLNEVRVETSIDGQRPVADVELINDTALALRLARRVLAESTFVGNPAVVMLTAAKPLIAETAFPSTSFEMMPEGYESILALDIDDPIGELNGSILDQCFGESRYHDCVTAGSDCFDGTTHHLCAPWRERCEQNPTTSVEAYSGTLAALIQSQQFARIYTVNVAFDLNFKIYFRGATSLELHPALGIDFLLRNRNFLIELANDYSQLPYGPNNRLDCAGDRPPEMQGRYYEASPSGSDLLRIARDLLRHARRPQEGESEWGDFRSRLIDPDEV